MRNIILIGSFIVIALFHGAPASAHGGVRFGLSIGGPIYQPAYVYPAPAYYYPAPPVVVARPAPVFVAPAPPYGPPNVNYLAPAEENWWYYCAAANQYYPHVQTCTTPWQMVRPAPPNLR